jgi:hypothetical protein
VILLKSPKLYKLIKVDMKRIVENDYNVEFSDKDIYSYDENKDGYKTDKNGLDGWKRDMPGTADNAVFRMTRDITGDKDDFNKYVIFVDVKKYSKEELDRIIRHGFSYDGYRFISSEKSASMQRGQTLGFIREDIYDQVEEKVTMGVKIDKTVVSKYIAYRGLFFTSGFGLEGYVPKIVIVGDHEIVIPNNKVRHLTRHEVEIDEYYYVRDPKDKKGKKFLKDRDGNRIKLYTGQKKMVENFEVDETTVDMTMQPFDGMGIHHPNISRHIQSIIGIEKVPTSMIVRLPYMKGVSHAVDYQTFFYERGVKTITDVFGVEHSVNDEMMIFTESMYKGIKYFGKSLDGWNKYWNEFNKHGHQMYINKWNKTYDEEHVYTRTNYQVLQTLSLNYDDFASLTDYSLGHIIKIASGDIVSSYGYLGLLGDRNNNPRNEYAKAMLINNKMRFDPHIRKYLISSIKKQINDLKYGKIWIKGNFKILTGDIIMLMEYIGGLDPVGCIPKGCFYSREKDGELKGKHALLRNPHIGKSENVIREGFVSDEYNKYCGHLANTIHISAHGIVMALLSGADLDGDLVFQTSEKMIIKGSPEVTPAVNLDDKATAMVEEYNTENIVKSAILSFGQRIGEISNIATSYLNKVPQKQDTIKKYQNYIDFLSIVNGVEIDSVKTNYRIAVPRYISQYSKPYPYFMKFVSPYYARQKKFNNSNSNMNRMARGIDGWEKNIESFIKDKNKEVRFDYEIMYKDGFEPKNEIIDKFVEVYKDFSKDIMELQKENRMLREYDKYKNYFKNFDMTKQELMESKGDWQYYYDEYKKILLPIVNDDISELASYLVYVAYELYPSKTKKFVWGICPEGVLLNLSEDDIILPVKDDNGEYEYLGKKYRLEKRCRCLTKEEKLKSY